MTKLSILTVACVLALSQGAQAALIQIQMEGVNFKYDGSSITSTVSPDPLFNVSFSQNDVLIGEDDTDTTLDLTVPGVSGLVSNAPNIVATGGGGTLEVDLGDGEFLDLDLSSGSVTFVPAGFVDFTFIGVPAGISGQNLPFGIVLQDPVSVSFSAQIVAGTLTVNANNEITAFRAAGTGEISAVPEPATLALLGLGTLLIARRRAR